ncbi:MAG TPA: murein transglycosylase A [Steroidobacteraceae bacterium]|nr:murein transglycosylase A [Steroidobacteraceae bacterium]
MNRTGRISGVAALAGAVLLAACATPPRVCPPAPPPVPHVAYNPTSWEKLPGWDRDRLQEAWPAFLESCDALGRRAAWSAVCQAARDAKPSTPEDVRAFFERYLEPLEIVKQTGRQSDEEGLITGYFEPVLQGSRSPSPEFNTPLYAPPPDLLTVDLGSVYPELKGKRLRARLDGRRVVPYYSRADLERDPALKGDELVWVDDAVAAFFLEVQGSGRVRLRTGETIRLHYADENGYPYRSIGRYLIDRGELKRGEATMPAIRAWALAHPDRLKELLDADPSVVFFHEEPLGDPQLGPKGSLGVPLTPGRSIAVDPSAVPLGAPVFIATTFPASDVALQRLVMSQDTGGAIRGPVRADFFWGTGPEAASYAGQMRQTGRMWLLWPRGAALPGS